MAHQDMLTDNVPQIEPPSRRTGRKLPLLGPMPGVEGSFEASAFTFRIAQAGGAGKILAGQFMHGRPERDCRSVDPRRCTDHTDEGC